MLSGSASKATLMKELLFHKISFISSYLQDRDLCNFLWLPFVSAQYLSLTHLYYHSSDVIKNCVTYPEIMASFPFHALFISLSLPLFFNSHKLFFLIFPLHLLKFYRVTSPQLLVSFITDKEHIKAFYTSTTPHTHTFNKYDAFN